MSIFIKISQNTILTPGMTTVAVGEAAIEEVVSF